MMEKRDKFMLVQAVNICYARNQWLYGRVIGVV